MAVHNHYKRIDKRARRPRRGAGPKKSSKSNILLLGPTGTGKTPAPRRRWRRILNVPFTIADADRLTEAGYVGEDVENIIVQNLQNADHDIEKAQRGIVYIDEIDKIARKGDNPSITARRRGEGGSRRPKILEGTGRTCPRKRRPSAQQEYLQGRHDSNIPSSAAAPSVGI